jgi:hypothetical protein
VSDYRGRIKELEVQRDAMLDIIGELYLDVDFLAKRSMKAGFVQMSAARNTGVSSNSIVGIAYGLIPIEEQELPEDLADLTACRLMFEKLPVHRKTKEVDEAMHRACQALAIPEGGAA